MTIIFQNLNLIFQAPSYINNFCYNKVNVSHCSRQMLFLNAIVEVMFYKSCVDFALRKITFKVHKCDKKVRMQQKTRCVIEVEKVNGCSDGEKTSSRNMA